MADYPKVINSSAEFKASWRAEARIVVHCSKHSWDSKYIVQNTLGSEHGFLIDLCLWNKGLGDSTYELA